jgi:hypothetical protein
MNALHLAEQATLGALMLERDLAESVTGWVRAEDFADPWHREVYASMRELHAAHDPLDPQRVASALTDRVGHHQAYQPHLVDLLQAAPIRPNGRRYAAMVLEASLRRQVAGQGVLLRAAALSAALSGHGRPIAEVTVIVDDALDRAEDRWSAATGARQVEHVAAVPSPERPTRWTEWQLAGLGADRLLQAHPPLDAAAVSEREAHLIAALVSHPEQIAGTATWLRPDAISNPAWRPVYAATVQLTELAQPVDVVTVAWEVRRTAARLGPGPGTRDLRDAVDAHAADDPAYLSRAVAGDHLRRTADHAAQALHTAAANPGVDLTDVLATGHLLTGALRDSAAALSSPHLAQTGPSPAPGRTAARTRSRGPAPTVVLQVGR